MSNYHNDVLKYDINTGYNPLSFDVNAIFNDKWSLDQQTIVALNKAGFFDNMCAKASTASFWAYQAWYLQTILPVVSYFATVTQQMKNILKYFNWFGVTAYVTKLLANAISISKNIRKTKHIDLTGKETQIRHLDKAAFAAFDTVITIGAFVGNFITHAAWATPLVFVILGGFISKSAYSCIKNSINYLKCEKPNTVENDKVKAQSPEKADYLKAVQYRHRVKLERAVFDLACIVLTTVFFGVCIANPIIGSIGMLAMGFISYYGREKYFTPKAKAAKTNAIAKHDLLVASDNKATQKTAASTLKKTEESLVNKSEEKSIVVNTSGVKKISGFSLFFEKSAHKTSPDYTTTLSLALPA